MRQLLSAESNAATTGWSYRNTFMKLFEKVAGKDYVNQMLYVDAKTFLPDLNLAYSDKLSMACSIEARVPFLDNEVVEFLQRVPPSLKIHGYTQKYLLRNAMDGVLPKEVLRRRKAAFGLPIRAWLKNELRDMLTDMLSEDRIRRRGLLDASTVTQMIRDNETGERDVRPDRVKRRPGIARRHHGRIKIGAHRVVKIVDHRLAASAILPLPMRE